jgi:hypothetical protein
MTRFYFIIRMCVCLSLSLSPFSFEMKTNPRCYSWEVVESSSSLLWLAQTERIERDYFFLSMVIVNNVDGN